MNAKEIIEQLTLEEKASLCSGLDFWHTKPIPRFSIPSMMMCDGPHGLRKQASESDQLGMNASVVATAFPTAAGIAASFDRELAEMLGGLLGEECQAEDVGLILGPGANIKRSPLCGRNFEYYSEDPFLSGEMAAAHIRGVQAKGVGACVKHFAVNNQETRRMTADALVDERALREIYLASFERAVKQGEPWSVMCSYNKVNGEYASQNAWLLNNVLRGDWGFDGFTVTDWGASVDHVKGVAAGLDLEMPTTGSLEDRRLVDAARSGKISEAAIDTAARRVLEGVLRARKSRDTSAIYDRETHHHMARKIARETAVLLKNDGGLLPLSGQRVAFIGKYAAKPRYQGAGSSHIHAYAVTCALEAVRSVAQVTYAQGFDDAPDARDNPSLLIEAIAAARAAEVAVLFVGLPDSYESEGFDRTHLRLPNNQIELIREVCAVNSNVVAVLHNGAPIEMPWISDVKAVLEMYLGGEAVGGAAVDLLWGAVSPCGKLAETFPLKLSDTPCYTSFPGDYDTVRYGEGVFVGYRHYATVGKQTLFPFGHGLSYTRFEYGKPTILSGGTVRKVSLDITNIGDVCAKEIVQLYLSPPTGGAVSRPAQELKGFEKLSLEPGETKTCLFELDSRAFSYWDERVSRWVVESGEYVIQLGASSADIRQSISIMIEGDGVSAIAVSQDTTFGDAISIPGATQVLEPLLQRFLPPGMHSDDDGMKRMLDATIGYMPIHGLRGFFGDAGTDELIDSIVADLKRLQQSSH
ncbi:MAG: glycoside hydrolase family 3 C-terminal domain-containing protein [Oscillospiraceae bacterium]|jgi:beta-glucosidase|nr:glycoside hydrolase family 3 C-terminal domain-containing protein [Oscillospiraceae bacterium]